MIKDLDDILKNCEMDKGNPFIVPEGYFARLNSDIMKRVAQQSTEAPTPTPHTLHFTAKAWRWVAACVCLMVISTTLYLHTTDNLTAKQTPTPAAQIADDEFNEAANYVMLDNNDMYQFLSEN